MERPEGPSSAAVRTNVSNLRHVLGRVERARLSGHRDWLPDSSGDLEVGSTRRSFTEEYKEQAAAFVLDGNRSVAVARNIGVHEMMLGKWVKKVRESRQQLVSPDAELTGSERLELIRLRTEAKDDKATIAELQMQVEFTMKVATWVCPEHLRPAV